MTKKFVGEWLVSGRVPTELSFALRRGSGEENNELSLPTVTCPSTLAEKHILNF